MKENPYESPAYEEPSISSLKAVLEISAIVISFLSCVFFILASPVLVPFLCMLFTIFWCMDKIAEMSYVRWKQKKRNAGPV